MMNLDMAVLGKKAFGDVHVRHDFDPRNQRRVKLLRRRGLFLEQAVNAIAQLQLVLKRHQMNIAGPLAQGGGNNDVDQVDHRRFVGHDLDVMEILVLDRSAVFGVEVFDHLLDGQLAALRNFFQQFRRFDRELADFPACQKPDIIDDPLTGRFGCSDNDCAPVDLYWKDAMSLDEIDRERARDIGGQLEPRKAVGAIGWGGSVEGMAVSQCIPRRNAAQILHSVEPASRFG